MSELTSTIKFRRSISSTGLWAWDVGNDQVSWDDRSQALYGFPTGAPPALQDILARLHQDDRPLVLARLNDVRAIPGDDEWNMEFRVVHPDGTLVWIHGLGRAERDADGHMRRLTGINLDVTARKRAERALLESRNQQYESAENARVLLESAAQGIVSVDEDGVTSYPLEAGPHEYFTAVRKNPASQVRSGRDLKDHGAHRAVRPLPR